MDFDPNSDSGFLIYATVLGISGILMLVLAALNIGSRAANAVIGLIATGYAGYLMYEFLTAEYFEYRFFWYAYALPVVAIYQLYTGLKARKAEAAAPAFTPPAPPQA